MNGNEQIIHNRDNNTLKPCNDGILPTGPYSPCLRMPFWQDAVDVYAHQCTGLSLNHAMVLHFIVAMSLLYQCLLIVNCHCHLFLPI